MKVLFVIGSLNCGGAERQFIELTSRIGEYGITPVICTLEKNNSSYDKIYLDRNVRHFKLLRRIKLDIKLVRNLCRIVKSEQTDIIQSWQPLAGMYSLLASKIMGKPLVCSSIRDAKEKNSFLELFSKKCQAYFSDVFVANSNQGFRSQFKKWRTNFMVIKNGIDMERFKNTNSSKIQSIYNTYQCRNKFVIGMVANLSERKDPFTLIKAAALIRNQIPNLEIFIIGDGKEKKFAQKLSDQLGVNDIVHLIGFKHDIENYISIFDVAVLLTNTEKHQEGISNFLLESIAMRKVVIATRGGGNQEIIRNGITGYLVRPKDEKDLYKKILMIKTHDQSALIDRAYNMLIDNFNMGGYVSKYYHTYQSLLSD